MFTDNFLIGLAEINAALFTMRLKQLLEVVGQIQLLLPLRGCLFVLLLLFLKQQQLFSMPVFHSKHGVHDVVAQRAAANVLFGFPKKKKKKSARNMTPNLTLKN